LPAESASGGGQGPVCFAVLIRVRPGRREEVWTALQELVPQVHSEPGCERYALHAVDGQDAFLTVERWATADAAQAHAQSPTVRRYRERIGDLAEPSQILQLIPAVLGDAVKGTI
jgi:quinol monooxygenase YgiN